MAADALMRFGAHEEAFTVKNANNVFWPTIGFWKMIGVGGMAEVELSGVEVS